MKRTLLSFITMLSYAGMLWALNVSTEPQYKKALLEEFTGINCGNCPDGHKIAAKLHLAQPENTFIMAIHAGHFAEAGPGDPDFITEEGTTINDHYAVSGYPCGMINRKVFDGTTPVLSRSFWNQYAREVCHELSPVNLAIECDYDEYKSEYTVTVAGYYTATPDSEQNNLCVALVQNNIQGYQSGSGVSDEYMHQHVLRDYFTPVWGDPIENISEGSRFEKTYKLILPETIGNTAVVPAQLEVIAFVTSGEGGEVLNVIGGRANPAMFDLPLAAEISEYKVPVGQNYGFDFLELYIENKGSVAITEATFDVTLNGTTSQAQWQGNIPAMTKQAVSINVDWQTTQIDENVYSVELTGLNGQNYSANSFSGEFGTYTPVTTSAVLKIKTDKYCSDNTFSLKDHMGNVVQTFGPYEDGVQATYEENITFEKDKVYCIEITDAWGNGILSPRGNFKLYDSNGNLLAQNMDISDHGCRLFVKANKNTAINEVESNDCIAINYTENFINISTPTESTTTIHNITGRCIFSAANVSTVSSDRFAPGVYIVKVTTSTGSKIQKIIIE